MEGSKHAFLNPIMHEGEALSAASQRAVQSAILMNNICIHFLGGL